MLLTEPLSATESELPSPAQLVYKIILKVSLVCRWRSFSFAVLTENLQFETSLYSSLCIFTINLQFETSLLKFLDF